MRPSVLLLFRAALDMPVAERARFFGDANADPADIAIVKSLLEALTESTTPSEAESPLQPIARRTGREGEQIGPFTLRAPLGTGGMGTVWLAERTDEFAQRVAIKWLHGSTSAQARARFAREREVLARLEHPAIARIVDGGEDQGVPWYAMEFVDGETLLNYVDNARMDLRGRLQIFLQLADAVQFAHQNFIVHRDLKPTNVLVNHQGDLKLLDFGIAKLLDGSVHLTELQSPMTVAYAAPEQIRGEAITAATDVYGLGLLMFELLTGQRPYRANSSAEMLQRITATDVPVPSRLALPDHERPPVDRRLLRGDLDVIVLKALHREPDRRYESARALADDVRRYLAYQPIHARADSMYYRAGKFLRRNAVASGVAGSLAIGLLVSAGWAFQKQQEALQNAQSARASNEFLLSRLTAASPWKDGATWTVRDLLKDTAQKVGPELADQQEARTSLYRTLRDALAVERPSIDALFPAEQLVKELRNRDDFQGESEALYELLRVQMHQIERLDLAEPTLLLLESRIPKLDPALARKVHRSRAYFENYRGAPKAALRAWMNLLPPELQHDYRFDPTATEFNAAQDAAAVSALIDLHRQNADLRNVIELLELLEWKGRFGASDDLPQQIGIVQSLVGPVSDLLPPDQGLALAEYLAAFGAKQFGAGSAMHEYIAMHRLVPLVRAGRFAECERIISEFQRESSVFPEESQLSIRRGYTGLALVAFNEGRPDKVQKALAQLDAFIKSVPGASQVDANSIEVNWLDAWARWRLGKPEGERKFLSVMQQSKELGAVYLEGIGYYELARKAFEQGDVEKAASLVNTVDPDGTFVVLNPNYPLTELRESLGLAESSQYRDRIEALHQATRRLIDTMSYQAPEEPSSAAAKSSAP